MRAGVQKWDTYNSDMTFQWLFLGQGQCVTSKHCPFSFHFQQEGKTHQNGMTQSQGTCLCTFLCYICFTYKYLVNICALSIEQNELNLRSQCSLLRQVKKSDNVCLWMILFPLKPTWTYLHLWICCDMLRFVFISIRNVSLQLQNVTCLRHMVYVCSVQL